MQRNPAQDEGAGQTDRRAPALPLGILDGFLDEGSFNLHQMMEHRDQGVGGMGCRESAPDRDSDMHQSQVPSSAPRE